MGVQWKSSSQFPLGLTNHIIVCKGGFSVCFGNKRTCFAGGSDCFGEFTTEEHSKVLVGGGAVGNKIIAIDVAGAAGNSFIRE